MATKRSVKDIAKELAEALAGETGNVTEVAARRDYWRQRTLEARNLVRKITPMLAEAQKQIAKISADVARERKHWVGPVDPQSNPPKGFYKSRGRD